MSRLRRPFLYDRYIFVTVDLLKLRTSLQGPGYQCLAQSLAKMREKHAFPPTAWVFLPDHWHATIYPRYPLTISTVLKAVKVSSMISINVGRKERGDLWQGRFPSLRSRASFDRALRTVKEYHETIEYIHLNPVRRGLVKRAEDWRWSSALEYAGKARTNRSDGAG
ncbi:MAG TPA: hypothetical protein VMT20_22770 [Terriglobia bacterium]|nr:hypothetical protein [Terriglobia bacterium]